MITESMGLLTPSRRRTVDNFGPFKQAWTTLNLLDCFGTILRQKDKLGHNLNNFGPFLISVYRQPTTRI